MLVQHQRKLEQDSMPLEVGSILVEVDKQVGEVTTGRLRLNLSPPYSAHHIHLTPVIYIIPAACKYITML
jgi:hypothetical protein